MLGQPQKMKIGAVVEDYRASGNADGAPRLCIRLNKPDANFSHSGANPPNVKITVGATVNN